MSWKSFALSVLFSSTAFLLPAATFAADADLLASFGTPYFVSSQQPLLLRMPGLLVSYGLPYVVSLGTRFLMPAPFGMPLLSAFTIPSNQAFRPRCPPRALAPLKCSPSTGSLPLSAPPAFLPRRSAFPPRRVHGNPCSGAGR